MRSIQTLIHLFLIWFDDLTPSEKALFMIALALALATISMEFLFWSIG